MRTLQKALAFQGEVAEERREHEIVGDVFRLVGDATMTARDLDKGFAELAQGRHETSLSAAARPVNAPEPLAVSG